MTKSNRYAVEATKTSLTIFETLVAAEGPLGVTAISERVGVSKSVVHNHLSTLLDLEYILKREEKYEPALRALALGNQVRAHTPIYDAAKPKVDNLAEATGETTTLFVIEDGQGVPAYVADQPNGWDPEFHEGERMPLHVNAPGKSILATFSEDRVDTILGSGDLTAATDATITDPDELRTKLSRIRDDGVSFCKEEQYEGVVGVAASVPTHEDNCTAAIGVCGPVDRLHGRYLKEDITGQVVSTTKAVGVELTGDNG